MSTQNPVEAQPQRAASGRVQRKRGKRIQKIVETAAELFGEHGYDAVSLDDVAERLDVTKGSLYYYFASKEELGTAAIETLGGEWTTRLEQLAAAHEGPPTATLRALLYEHITIAVRDYPAALGLFLVPRDWPEPQATRIKDMRTRHNDVFRRVIEDGVANGEFAVTTVDTVLQCMHAAMSRAPDWARHFAPRSGDEAIAELTDTLMMLVGRFP